MGFASDAPVHVGSPGHTGPSQFKVRRICSYASFDGNAVIWSCRGLSASAASAPMISGRVDSVCAILTKTGPSDATPSRKRSARVRRSSGTPVFSSQVHVA